MRYRASSCRAGEKSTAGAATACRFARLFAFLLIAIVLFASFGTIVHASGDPARDPLLPLNGDVPRVATLSAARTSFRKRPNPNPDEGDRQAAKAAKAARAKEKRAAMSPEERAAMNAKAKAQKAARRADRTAQEREEQNAR